MASRGIRAFIVLRGIVVATLFIALWFWLASSVQRFDPMLGVAPPEWLRPAGWVLVPVGGVLAAYCIAVFATRGRGTPAPFDPPQVFVASGPYRYVRNPMYVGAICALLGGGLIARSVSILLLALAFWATCTRIRVALRRAGPRAPFRRIILALPATGEEVASSRSSRVAMRDEQITE